jgi:hypothetical protein
MEYEIRPYFYSKSTELRIFFAELNQMIASQIDDGIYTCKQAIEEGKTGFSWGAEVFEIKVEKEISVLEYHGEFVRGIPTREILEMLTDYKNAIDHLRNGSET